MSSDGDELETAPVKVKRRRLQRSCDACRKAKRRCDSATQPDGNCSHCKSFNAECTHTEPTRKRGPKNKQVEELKQQLSVLESKLRTVQPEASPPSILPSTSVIKYPSPPEDSSPAPRTSLPEEDLSHDELSERFRQFNLSALKHRFFGSSSGFMLVKNAIAIKEEYLGRPIVTQFRRPEFWNQRPWELSADDERPQYVFPEHKLMKTLIGLYFEMVHPCLPLLHRPTFERAVAEDLHINDPRFGGLLLSLLAVASRYSDDPRVFVPESNSALSAGWNFFKQVRIIRKSLFDEPSIHEVQTYCLITLYTLGTSSPQASWLYLGLGVRFIQERGEHRRKRDGTAFSPEHELWKRCLLTLDRTVCSFLGRPTAIHVEDYDLELPIEVDDEYWEHPDPNQRMKQPPGKPSLVTYFNCHIRLCEILGSTLRRLYASNKSRILMGLTGSDWEQRAVAELDSAMNEFLGSLPEHLRWDPNRTGVFFDQSATLHTMYYWLQITIHRPYIHKPTILAFPSLAICTSAARSAIHVVDVWLTRFQRVSFPLVQTAVFISGVVLLLNLFGVKRAGLPIDIGKELAHVSTSMRILKFMETRWQSAGRLWELLQELQAWDGPPPPKKPDAVKPPPDMDNADMCPTKRKVLEEDSELSVFSPATNETAPTPSPEKALQTQNQNQPPVAAITQAVVPMQGAQPPPQQPLSMDLWSDALMTQPSLTAQQAGMSMEQLLAATAMYDDSTGLTQSMGQWSDSTALANMMADDELMSMWSGLPGSAGNWTDWDEYIDAKSRATGQPPPVWNQPVFDTPMSD
ncbi:Zn(2)-C6 fungal-type domain-containing protein [Mycena chlorophos]|uniref:Zn(2)-C6 fungal-type domain-containing protein n=1 Tax=Mycena chlorophos TaxID=658473 RepID=A0A8H6W7Q6_MYCCL|nr:Zn(2)-C6 fungal-type domain-containing protein [Mycena chlorophos]